MIRLDKEIEFLAFKQYHRIPKKERPLHYNSFAVGYALGIASALKKTGGLHHEPT